MHLRGLPLSGEKVLYAGPDGRKKWEIEVLEVEDHRIKLLRLHPRENNYVLPFPKRSSENDPFREREWPSSWPSAAGLLEWAKRARMFAYAPYSGFSVGAALYEEGGKIFFPAATWKTPPTA
ncbi:hypothetical protein MASR2M17_01940 [Aminivibrio sp.]